jgi:putative ABC transport system permease protein
VIAPRWRKILRDLWSNKSRTILVVISIAVGVGALGMVISSYGIITSDLPSQFEQINPAHAEFFISPFDDALVFVIRQIDGLKFAEGRFSDNVRVRIGEYEWQDMKLNVIQNYDQINLNKINLVQGGWPSGEKEIIIERSSIPLLGAQLGDVINIHTSDGIERELIISGISHDIGNPPSSFTNTTSGYINFNTLEWLGYPRSYNTLLIQADGAELTYEDIRELTYDVEDKITKSGRTVYSTTIPIPGEHWLIPYLTPMTVILVSIGVTIFLVGGFLIVNTITAMLAQQKRQIGIMKSIGAKSSHIQFMYIVMLVIVGLLAFSLAAPLGILGTNLVVNLITNLMNFEINNYVIPRTVFYLQAFLCILFPIIVAFFPISKSVKVSVHQAIIDYGIGNEDFGESWFDRFLGGLGGFSRPVLLSIRNTFRKKMRLILTLLTLALATAIFISVMSVYTSLVGTLNNALEYYGFDLVIFFNREYRSEQILDEISRVPGIDTAETWGIDNARIVNSDGSETNNILFVSPPTNTKLIQPSVLEGRWLYPNDENAIVINTDVIREKPDIKVGEIIKLKIGGSESEWTVVGITRSVMTGPWIYANYPYFARRLGKYGLSSGVYIALDDHSPESQYRMGAKIEDHLENVGLRVRSVGKVVELRALAVGQFQLIFGFLMVMAIFLSIVGGLGLMGTMSLNVIERTREIGVMRAIGASNGSIFAIVVIEGVVIGILSWLFGLGISMPLSRFLSSAVGEGFLNAPLIYHFSYFGSALWFFLIIIISLVSSSLPARSAVRTTVREVLVYE